MPERSRNPNSECDAALAAFQTQVEGAASLLGVDPKLVTGFSQTVCDILAALQVDDVRINRVSEVFPHRIALLTDQDLYEAGLRTLGSLTCEENSVFIVVWDARGGGIKLGPEVEHSHEKRGPKGTYFPRIVSLVNSNQGYRTGDNLRFVQEVVLGVVGVHEDISGFGLTPPEELAVRNKKLPVYSPIVVRSSVVPL